MNNVAKLLTDESKIVFADGKIFNGAVGVSGYMVQLIETSFVLGVNRGLKIGFIGGVASTGVGLVAYKYYTRKKSNTEKK